MNKLRKIAAWFWLSKERMVLAVMVIVLCFRVYQVLYPAPDEPDGQNFQPPKNSLSADVQTPGIPPRIPPPIELDNWTLLWNRSPFTWVEPGTKRTRDDGTIQDIDLELLSLQEVSGGGWVAQIRSGNSRKWHSEGAAFDAYQLLSIDPDTECVMLFAEEVQGRVEICKE